MKSCPTESKFKETSILDVILVWYLKIRKSKFLNSIRWEMSPSAVNAYYSPTRNQIVFPSKFSTINHNVILFNIKIFLFNLCFKAVYYKVKLLIILINYNNLKL